MAEEAFFRGFLQDRLAGTLASVRAGKGIAVIVSALLFGLAHFAGGLAYVGLATLAGFGYALAYARTQRIESAIATHFLFNPFISSASATRSFSRALVSFAYRPLASIAARRRLPGVRLP